MNIKYILNYIHVPVPNRFHNQLNIIMKDYSLIAKSETIGVMEEN